jgi:ligand-binding sensor domain-containing protein
LDPVTGRICHYSHDVKDPSSLSSDAVKSSGEDQRGQFWVGTSEGLDEFDRKTGKVVLRIPVREPSSLLAFHEDRFGVFWIFQVSRDALAVYDRNTNTLTNYSLRREGPSGDALTGVTAMVEDHAGNLWAATHGAGLLKFDRAHRTFVSYRNDPTVPDSLPQDDVECLFVDHEGSIWAGLGSKGLIRFSTTPKPFRLLPRGLGNPNATGNPFIGAIYADDQGTLWVGTPDAVNRINKAGNYASYRRTAGPGARTDAITIREDRAHNLWVGTYGHGLLRFDTRTRKFKTYRHDARNPYSLSDDFVSRLLVDHNGKLWAATSEALNRFDPATERFTSYRPSPQNKSLFYLELVEDSHDALWLGTHSSGLQRFDPVTGQFTTYQHDLNGSETVSDNRVNSIYFDRAGTMWVEPKTGSTNLIRRLLSSQFSRGGMVYRGMSSVAFLRTATTISG